MNHTQKLEDLLARYAADAEYAAEAVDTIRHDGDTVTIVKVTKGEWFAFYLVWSGADGEAHVYRCEARSVEAATKYVFGKIEVARADEAILPALIALIDASAVGTELVPATGLSVGDVAYVHAMGRYRRGLVTKLGRSNVEVAYTTASSGGRVFRKSTKPLVRA